MKKFVGAAMAVTLLVSGLDSQAQRIKVESGSLAGLAAEKELNTEFVYEGMSVGKYKDEADYIARKSEEYNKKEPGRGDAWVKAWKDDRESRFEPKFHELFAKASGVASGTAPSAKYTMIVKTVHTEPGYNIGITRGNAQINLEIVIVETANKSKEVARISVQKALGRTFAGMDFDTGQRIAEAYADAGKALGAYVKKNG